MELYNTLFQDTRAFLDGKTPKTWDYSERDCWTDIGSSELVMQRDAAYELGASGHGSANYVLFSSNPDFVRQRTRLCQLRALLLESGLREQGSGPSLRPGPAGD